VSGETPARGQPLSLRLALVLSLVVVAVLLITGIAVNRLVSRGLSDELTAAERDRIALVASSLSDVDLTAPGGRRGVQLVLGRLANSIGGRAELVTGAGRVIAGAGGVPGGGASTVEISEPVTGQDAQLVVTLRSPTPAFLRVFNLTLLIAGLLAVLALVVAAAVLSDRLTRPLRGVAAAAHRLGAGDLSARASGGADRESRELAGAFNQMAARLQQSETLRRRAASDMAHDLATPATVLESQLQAMVDGVLPADREQLERARSAAGAVSGVIVQLRELVDAEAAVLQREPAPLAVGELLEELERTLGPFFRERRVTLAVEAPPAGLVAIADRGQVARALRNVVTNAAQHSPADGQVRVSAERSPQGIVVRIADQGGGVAPDDLPHIFERFYRADPARSGGEQRSGSGIGLTISRELLRANGGDVWVDRTSARGTVFAIGLRSA
jgi:signal transduction histidine kinase